MSIDFDAENRCLTFRDGQTVPINQYDEFEMPRAWIGDSTLSRLRDVLKVAHQELNKFFSVVLVAPPMDGIRVYGGDDRVYAHSELVRHEIFELSDKGDLSVTLCVDYVRPKNREEFDDRVGDYFARRGVTASRVKFCGPAESLVMRLNVPLSWTVLQYGGFADTVSMLLQHDRVNLKDPAGAYALVSAGAPALLLGETESEWLEVKRENYGVAVESQKYEFACDVASFANSDLGGLIVIGIASERDSSGNDVLTRVTPCRKGSMQVQRYMQILRDRLIPAVEGLRIDVISIASGDIVTVYIPPQPEGRKPFIVKGAMVESKVSGSFFSIPHRRGSDKWAETPEEIHSMLVAARAVLRNIGPAR
ncbi:ATP-binding protein [Streptomyces sp. CL7]|uniref:AlbA family DNA-binding domain-containing protein n=1 Tax=Streptomyces sp. CL7 TaxID=3096006 RepID=UPI002A76177F|nr:ATP-binding protein [Streptomyces sp. CL7]WPP32024.1 ATP-binding protein [Streptomyces sp. CL7]